MDHKKSDISNQWPACFTFSNIIGRSPAIQNSIRIAKVAARSSASTLILGESGVGKELFAQSIHNASRRVGKPFVSINCGAIPRELIEAELFGYVPNAFTGASSKGAPGKFSIASGGTLFLDEVADLSMDAQVKLLRAIAGGEITRVGSASPEKVDVRIICATNKNMHREIEAGNFREDLYYRINVFEIKVPALRERIEDVEDIVEYFIPLYGKNLATEGQRIEVSPKFMAGLKKYRWPGNIRQLQAVLEREIYHLSGPPFMLDHLPDAISGKSDDAASRCEIQIKPLSQMESDLINAALARYNRNVPEICKALEISRATLYRKINLYKLGKSGKKTLI